MALLNTNDMRDDVITKCCDMTRPDLFLRYNIYIYFEI